MNRLDQQEPTGHNGDPKPFDRIKKKAVQGLTAFTGWMIAGKDRLTEQYKRLTDPETKSFFQQRQAIKPVRIEPTERSNQDRSAVRAEEPDRLSDSIERASPTVSRIEDTAPIAPIDNRSLIDEAPDRTFEPNSQSNRPDLYHVTPGTPSLIEDTAVHEIVNESSLGSSDETMVIPFVQLSQSETFIDGGSEQEITTSSVRQAAGSAQIQVPETGHPVQRNALDRYLPGVSAFFAYYHKRRKADRAIRRNTRERVYRLKGYTTVAKVNRKRQSEKKQRLLRRALIGIIAVLTLVILFQLYNPFKDLSEWYRILGISSLDELTQTTTIETAPGQTIITAPTTTSTGLITSATTTSR